MWYKNSQSFLKNCVHPGSWPPLRSTWWGQNTIPTRGVVTYFPPHIGATIFHEFQGTPRQKCSYGISRHTCEETILVILGKTEASVEMSQGSKRTETHLKSWWNVSSLVAIRHFVCSAWILMWTHWGHDVSGKGIGVQFLHKTKDKQKELHRGWSYCPIQQYVKNTMVRLPHRGTGEQYCTQQTYSGKKYCHTLKKWWQVIQLQVDQTHQ